MGGRRSCRRFGEDMGIPATLGALLVLISLGCGGATSLPASPTPLPPFATPGASVSIVMGASALTATAYSPNPLRLPLGNAVTWVNNDNTAHTSTGDGGAWHSGEIAPGRSFSRTFTTAGTFSYHCTLHPGMVGTIEVQ
jgi:plastocyanin